MLVREIAAQYLAGRGTLRIDASEAELGDLAGVGPTAELAEAEPQTGDVIVLAVDAGRNDLAEHLGGVVVPGTVVVLLLGSTVADLPVARIAQAAQVAGLAFVELVPVEPPGTVRAAVVCRPSRVPVAVRRYLGDNLPGEGAEAATHVDLDAQNLRIAWEWGLADGRTRALEVQQLASAARVVELEGEIAGLRSGLEAARGLASRAEDRAVSEARRRGALQQSPSFLVGRAVLTLRRHPIQGSRQLLGVIRRGIRA